MKKWVKVLLIVLAVIFVAVALLAIWQWKNIKSIYVGINESAEEITRQRNENQRKLAEEVDKYLDGSIRNLTPEEKTKIESGEVNAEEVYKQVFEEKYNEIQVEKTENNRTSPTKDEIVSKYMAQLYSLQSEYTAKAETTISQGAHYYESLKKVKDKTTARADTITHFTPIVRGIEAECDKKVNAIIANLKKELVAIGAETDIVRTIENAYAAEKQLKLSYYANKYLK